MKIKKIIITGTHTTPAIELIKQLQEDKQYKWEIFYIGRKHNSSVEQIKSIESKIIPEIGIKFYGIECGKFDRRWIPNTIKGIPDIFKGYISANKLIQKIKPNIVISFGGYVSVPVIIASKLNKIKSITHEQTSTISLSTKINNIFTTKSAISFPNKNKKFIQTGNLLRREIYDKKSKTFNSLFKNKKKPIIFITAGNQGSRIINKNILSIYNDLSKYNIVHQTGEVDYKEIKQFSIDKNNYFVFDYIKKEDIGWILNNSNIIISRSGANTSQEIVALNKKTILIPLLVSQQNEQKINASWVKSKQPKQTFIINQENLTPQELLKNIKKIEKIKINKTNNELVINHNLLKLIHETL